MSDRLTLALDGSGPAGSVAVISGATVLASRQLDNTPIVGKSGRDELFLPMVASCLEDAGAGVADLERIVCGAGPGSFTSLRIAASIAKGIAVGSGIPLYEVSSLLLIVAGSAPGRYLATLDAMRGELFAATFEIDGHGTVSELGPPQIISEAAISEVAASSGAELAGTAAARAWKAASSAAADHGATLEHLPHARRAAHVMSSIVAAGKCDLDTWEPMYGRLAEAQVRWEAAHGRPLTSNG